MWIKTPHMTVAGDQMPPVNEQGEVIDLGQPLRGLQSVILEP